MEELNDQENCRSSELDELDNANEQPVEQLINDKNTEANLVAEEPAEKEPAKVHEAEAPSAYNKYNENNQIRWTNNQVCQLEREMLLNNYTQETFGLSNWTKVILCALSVLLPGVGQIVGIIAGLVFISNDYNSDKRTYGAALLTISVVAFILLSIFWFLFILTLSPRIY